MRGQSGQATIEWTGVVLLVSLALTTVLTVGPRVDGRSLGALIVHRIACAVRGGCDDGDAGLVAAYGAQDAALVRAYAPGLVYEPRQYTLPVDYRECRSHGCSDAPDDPQLDAHRSTRGGHRATAFTRVVREGDETFIQYWLYYPDSTTTALGARALWGASPEARLATWAITGRPRYPGYHPDDWESYQVRIDRSGSAKVRASSHHGYQGCKQRRCTNRWTDWTGWTRVSRGSHAGHIPLRSERTATTLDDRFPFVHGRYRYHPLYPGRDLHERTTTAPGLRLVPLEGIDPRTYRGLDPGIVPPWRKKVYTDPRSDSTS